MTTSERGTANGFATDSLVQLEFAKVVKLVVGKTQTPYGKLLAEGLMPLHDHGRILQALRETEEARLILQEDGPLRLGSGDDLLPHLETLHTEGLRLEPEVLRDVRSALESASETRQQLFNSEHSSLLIAFAKRLTPIPELVAEIRRSIGQHGEKPQGGGHFQPHRDRLHVPAGLEVPPGLPDPCHYRSTGCGAQVGHELGCAADSLHRRMDR